MQESNFYKKFLQDDGSYLYKGYKIYYEAGEYHVFNMMFECIEFYADSISNAFEFVDEYGFSYNNLYYDYE